MPRWNNGWNGSPFFNPNSQYGGSWAPGQFADTGVGDVYLGQNPEVAWTRRIAGYDPSTAQGQNLRGQWAQIYEGFKAANLTNPNLTISQYIDGLDPEMIYAAQTAQQRGENPGRLAPRARTISRAYGG